MRVAGNRESFGLRPSGPFAVTPTPAIAAKKYYLVVLPGTMNTTARAN
jgi:hypothetical protein